MAAGFTVAKTWTSLVAQTVKRLPTMRETRIQSLGWEDLLKKEMATPSSILAWKTPRTEEPGRLQSVGSQSRTQLSDFTKVKDTFIRTQPKCPLMDEWIKKMWQIYIYIYRERGIFLLLMLFSH